MILNYRYSIQLKLLEYPPGRRCRGRMKLPLNAVSTLIVAEQTLPNAHESRSSIAICLNTIAVPASLSQAFSLFQFHVCIYIYRHGGNKIVIVKKFQDRPMLQTQILRAPKYYRHGLSIENSQSYCLSSVCQTQFIKY